ncbi:MAG: hypothetical protein VR72_03050 [Clostridiaceae bacterium BRH_c20a]|nr:MAG: hypothetical protein VR72_03050 [Clostridiaceae bacterium BRH_c20a]
MFNDFITPDMLKIFLVAVALVVLYTEFFKKAFDFVFKITGIVFSWVFTLIARKVFKREKPVVIVIKVPTEYICFLFACIVIFLPLIITEQLNIMVIFMGLTNAILLSMTAKESYNSIRKKILKKYSDEGPSEKFKPPEVEYKV